LIESPQAVVACSIFLFESLNHGLDGSTTASISADQASPPRSPTASLVHVETLYRHVEDWLDPLFLETIDEHHYLSFTRHL